MSTDGLQNAEKIRILVLGDSGVGKTSLVELVCSGTELRKPRSTVGCTIHMKIHESRSTVALHNRMLMPAMPYALRRSAWLECSVLMFSRFKDCLRVALPLVPSTTLVHTHRVVGAG